MHHLSLLDVDETFPHSAIDLQARKHATQMHLHSHKQHLRSIHTRMHSNPHICKYTHIDTNSPALPSPPLSSPPATPTHIPRLQPHPCPNMCLYKQASQTRKQFVSNHLPPAQQLMKSRTAPYLSAPTVAGTMADQKSETQDRIRRFIRQVQEREWQ